MVAAVAEQHWSFKNNMQVRCLHHRKDSKDRVSKDCTRQQAQPTSTTLGETRLAGASPLETMITYIVRIILQGCI